MAFSVATLKSTLKNFCDTTKPGSWYEIRAWHGDVGKISAAVAWDGFKGVEITKRQEMVWGFLGLNLSVDDRNDISMVRCEEDGNGIYDDCDPNPILSVAVDEKDLRIKELEARIERMTHGPGKEPTVSLEIKDERVAKVEAFGRLDVGSLFYFNSLLWVKVSQGLDCTASSLAACLGPGGGCGKVVDFKDGVLISAVKSARLTILD